MKIKHVLAAVGILALAGAFVSWMAMERLGEAEAYANIAKMSLFDSSIKTYILTTSCERRTDHLTQWIPKGSFVLDRGDTVTESCKSHPNWDVLVLGEKEEYKSAAPAAPPTRYRAPETDEEREQVAKDPDLKFRTAEFQEWMEHVEPRYKTKYADTLRACANGSHDLCMLLEDDIIFINEPETSLFRLAVQTFAKYSGPQVSWDCSKKGNGWRSRKIDGNKSQCRIVHRQYAGCLADYFDSFNGPADIALAQGMHHCQMEQKWFLLVQHVGRKSTMGHKN
ncbi:hypothetical protein CJU90_3808 [Yarrowia sp. C11]|nr:hypothetical protein CKK34_5418 [Yarrowia sp. E02]KAG5367510.1 hypothetical protein CJU90_3808 [Yarrowia sp. C11]